MDGDFIRKTNRIEPAKGSGPAGDYDLVPDTQPAPALKPCPSCGRLLHADSRRCVHCGEGPGAAPSTSSDTPRPCAFCKYDLRGTPSNRCPECGKKQPRASRRARDELMYLDNLKDEVRRCIIYLSLAVGLIIAVNLIATRDLLVAVKAFVAFAIIVGVANVTYLFLSLIWLGFEGGLKLTILRISAATGAAFFAFSIMSFIIHIPLIGCLFYLSPMVPMVIYASMLWELFDHDLQDAFLISFVTLCTTVAAFFGLIAIGFFS